MSNDAAQQNIMSAHAAYSRRHDVAAVFAAMPIFTPPCVAPAMRTAFHNRRHRSQLRIWLLRESDEDTFQFPATERRRRHGLDRAARTPAPTHAMPPRPLTAVTSISEAADM